MKSTTIDMLGSFAKHPKKEQWRSSRDAVIYTRVSTKEQADNNTSLEIQERECRQYAIRLGYTIIKEFGGTYESAKTDERKEFKLLLDFVKRNKEIGAIIVHNYDRFSRSQENFYQGLQLKALGVKILSCTQHVDPTTESGRLQQSIFFAFASYDNEVRKTRTKSGMREALLNGYWVGMCPFGYTNLCKKERAQNHKYVINEEGERLKLAFRWKAKGNISDREIVDKLSAMGSRIHYKSLTRMLSNPFYCGYLSHSLIPGQLIPGKHPPLVSESLFMKANKIIQSNPLKGKSKKHENDNLPLKGFIFDELSGSQITGYKTKGIYYYKARTKGTSLNVRADYLNEMFLSELKQFEMKKEHVVSLAKLVESKVMQKVSDRITETKEMEQQIVQFEKKIGQLERRYVEDNLERNLYEKYRTEYEQSLKQIVSQLEQSSLNSSNLKKAIENGILISQNLCQLWLSSAYPDKQRLQRLVFPEGMYYTKENDRVRTPRVNSLFACIASAARVSENKNDQKNLILAGHSRRVASSGIEPESGASETLILSIVLRGRIFFEAAKINAITE